MNFGSIEVRRFASEYFSLSVVKVELKRHCVAARRVPEDRARCSIRLGESRRAGDN
jgi:hypothetical protein